MTQPRFQAVSPLLTFNEVKGDKGESWQGLRLQMTEVRAAKSFFNNDITFVCQILQICRVGTVQN